MSGVAVAARGAALAVSGLVAGYGSGTAPRRQPQVGAGERVGRSGATGPARPPLRALMGLLPVRAGEMRFAGSPIRALETFEVARLGLAYVPQGRDIFAEFSVEQNLLLGCIALADRAARDLSPAFEAFPWLHARRRERAGDLSGGQQQQLAIAAPSLRVLPLRSTSPGGVQPRWWTIVEVLARQWGPRHGPAVGGTERRRRAVAVRPGRSSSRVK
jgi:branched-chain amino acid transport system ATP-binding protein/urea transport system ATP-binding protein